MFYRIYNLKIHPGSFYRYLFLRNWFSFASKFPVPLILNESILYRHFFPREGIIPLMKMAFPTEGPQSKLKPYPITDLFIGAIMPLKISILPSTREKCWLILNDITVLIMLCLTKKPIWVVYIQSYSYAQTSDLTIKLKKNCFICSLPCPSWENIFKNWYFVFSSQLLRCNLVKWQVLWRD